MLVVKNMLFIAVLVYASYCDIKTRIIPDKVHVMIILLGFIGIDWLPSILGLLLVPLPFFVVALVKGGSMGGGDIKFVGACSFYLGMFEGLVGSCLGLGFGILVNVLYFGYEIMEYNAKIALIPYFSIGLVLLLTINIFF